MTENSKENKKALGNRNNKLLEIENDKGIVATYLLSLFTKITNPEQTSHFKLVKEPISKGVSDLSINKQKKLLYLTIRYHSVIQVKVLN